MLEVSEAMAFQDQVLRPSVIDLAVLPSALQIL